MNQHFSTAIELNNIGVQLLEARSYRRAMKTLKESIDAMKLCVRPTTAGNKDDIRLVNARRRLSETNVEPMSKKTQVYSREHGFEKTKKNKPQHVNNCTDPILIDANTTQEQEETCRPDIESAIIFYNLALAHMCMFGRVKADKIFLDGALQLFQMAYSVALPVSGSTLLMDMTIEDIKKISDARLTIAIGVLNNLVQLQQSMGKHSEARDSMFRLQRLGHAFKQDVVRKIENSAAAAA